MLKNRRRWNWAKQALKRISRSTRSTRLHDSRIRGLITTEAGIATGRWRTAALIAATAKQPVERIKDWYTATGIGRRRDSAQQSHRQKQGSDAKSHTGSLERTETGEFCRQATMRTMERKPVEER
jgi:hypothetical protein